MFNLILETIIPADPDLSMPSAADIDFATYTVRYGLQDSVGRYSALVHRIALEKCGLPFAALNVADRLAVINATRNKDTRLFFSMITHVFRSYYTHREVLTRISSGAVPPFPQGNELEDDDWTLLEPVYLRGPVYRTVKTP